MTPAFWLYLTGLACFIAGGAVQTIEYYDAQDDARYHDAKRIERQRKADLLELQAARALQANEEKGGPEPLNDFARGPEFNEPTLAEPQEDWSKDPGPAVTGW